MVSHVLARGHDQKKFKRLPAFFCQWHLNHTMDNSLFDNQKIVMLNQRRYVTLKDAITLIMVSHVLARGHDQKKFKRLPAFFCQWHLNHTMVFTHSL
jgi:hypothetical protein